jgi:hypothetical protein
MQIMLAVVSPTGISKLDTRGCCMARMSQDLGN